MNYSYLIIAELIIFMSLIYVTLSNYSLSISIFLSLISISHFLIIFTKYKYSHISILISSLILLSISINSISQSSNLMHNEYYILFISLIIHSFYLSLALMSNSISLKILSILDTFLSQSIYYLKL
jgi:hypothetical protein